MGSQKHENVGDSQSVLIMNDPIISPQHATQCNADPPSLHELHALLHQLSHACDLALRHRLSLLPSQLRDALLAAVVHLRVRVKIMGLITIRTTEICLHFRIFPVP
eukprot:COSAG01_NODE_1405_length_10451_cov_8.718998_13_plen_106_part_00